MQKLHNAGAISFSAPVNFRSRYKLKPSCCSWSNKSDRQGCTHQGTL